MIDSERLMEDDVRSGVASAEVLCMACDQTFAASLWQPRMCCPHCETIGYPDQAGYNLIPLTWLCPHCEHENDGMTNFCLNCGEGQTTRCLRCETPVYTTACTRCGTIQEPLLRRKRLLEQREQRFHPIRSHVIAQQARLDPTPPPSHNPAYGVTEWRPLVVDTQDEQKGRPPQPQEQHDPQAAPAAPAPTPAQSTQRTSTAKPAAPSPSQRLPSRTWGDVRWGGLLFIIIGVVILVENFVEGGLDGAFNSAVVWFDEVLLANAASMVGVDVSSTAIILLIVTVVVGVILFVMALPMFNRISREIIK